MNKTPRKILKEVFGYNDFRPLQEEIIDNIIAKKDSLVIMPTGGGKSLCYQIPALVFPGLTIVISPLISLMKDQVQQLIAQDICAVVLNSSLSDGEYRENVGKIKDGTAKLLYVAPETLLKAGIRDMLSKIQVDCFTIDEAHCISEWGHDFRPEYRQLAHVRKEYPDAVCTAFTATATPRVQEDIAESLELRQQNTFVASFNRENLMLEVIPKDNPTQQTVDFLRRFPDKSGIIYCFSRKQVDQLYADLQSEGFSVKPYHAGLSDSVRRKNQELFIRDDVQIIVATIAFGMGINKPNVRFVVHYDLPKNIESYYQEIGRAGRDGLRAHCLLLFGLGDAGKIRYFINQKEEKEKRIANTQLSSMVHYAESFNCRRIPLMNYFGEKYGKSNCELCDNCLDEETKLDDITVLAQKFLSCVYRTGQKFGVNHIVDVLRGSSAKKVLDFRHQNISTYGIGKDLSQAQWQGIARQCISLDLLLRDDEKMTLSLTAKALEVFKGKELVMGKVPEAKAETRRSRRRAKIVESDISYNTELFEGLRALRKMLADKSRIPPYAVFPDKSLIEMAAYYPTSKESMLQIYGVGAGRFSKYGKIFLDTIKQFSGSKEEEAAKPKPDISIRSQYGKKKYHKVGEAYNAGASIEKLVADNNVQIGTIFGHLYNYWLDDYPLRNSDFSSFVDIDYDETKRVFAVFKNEGTELLRPVFEALDEKYDYTKLRILRVCYIAGEPSGKTIKPKILNYKKENDPWSEYDDTLLAKIYETEKDLQKLAALFLRKPESVGIRLLKLKIPENL